MRPRMGPVVGCPQIAGADMGIDLRGDQAFMAQQFLHTTDVGSSIEQMGRETMPQRVWAGPSIEARFSQVFL